MNIKRHKDFLNENIEKSIKGLAKFGMLPQAEIITRVEKLITDEVFDPVDVIIQDNKDLDILFMPGSSLKRDIKNALKNDELVNTYYNTKKIDFENSGDMHYYTLYPLSAAVETEEEEEPTIEEIVNDLIANSEFREDDLYGEEILMDELDNYLPNSSYDIKEEDHAKIVAMIINKIGTDYDEED